MSSGSGPCRTPSRWGDTHSQIRVDYSQAASVIHDDPPEATEAKRRATPASSCPVTHRRVRPGSLSRPADATSSSTRPVAGLDAHEQPSATIRIWVASRVAWLVEHARSRLAKWPSRTATTDGTCVTSCPQEFRHDTIVRICHIQSNLGAGPPTSDLVRPRAPRSVRIRRQRQRCARSTLRSTLRSPGRRFVMSPFEGGALAGAPSRRQPRDGQFALNRRGGAQHLAPVEHRLLGRTRRRSVSEVHRPAPPAPERRTCRVTRGRHQGSNEELVTATPCPLGLRSEHLLGRSCPRWRLLIQPSEQPPITPLNQRRAHHRCQNTPPSTSTPPPA
jgi:hypothetical protein